MITTLDTKGNLKLIQDGDHVIMEGGERGTHSIFVPDYDEKREQRIAAHWRGYCENNDVDFDAIETEVDNAYEAGDDFSIWINQGFRDAVVLATVGEQMIVEYEMPAGTTALVRMDNLPCVQSGKSVSYRSCPKKWVSAISEQSGEWRGESQQGFIQFPVNN